MSSGRLLKEPVSTSRNEYQRDRDRIIHCSAFRRLEYKTQVFVNHEGDMFRTRLTHSIEVSQIARGITRALGCHEDLAETISLAHDLGHTPFGHAGQNALNKCMNEFGGFEHNLQSLRIVDDLERRYAHFDGLNLMFESREGILKHCSLKNAKKLGVVGERFIKKQQPSLEAQIVNIADEIAYINHDIDDGFRSGLLSIESLMSNLLFKSCAEEVHATCLETIDEVFVWLISTQVLGCRRAGARLPPLVSRQSERRGRCGPPTALPGHRRGQYRCGGARGLCALRQKDSRALIWSVAGGCTPITTDAAASKSRRGRRPRAGGSDLVSPRGGRREPWRSVRLQRCPQIGRAACRGSV